MSDVQDTVQVAAIVPREVADALRARAKVGERSIAAEIRLALKAWVELDAEAEAA